MSTGEGSIIRSNKVIPSGSPFTIGSARNGLSVDSTGRIVLGQDVGAVGDPAQLLNAREIPLAGFALEATDGGNKYFLLDKGVGNFGLGDLSLFVEPSLQIRFSTAGNPTIELFTPDQLGNFIDLVMFHGLGAHRFVLDIQGSVNDYQMRFDINEPVFGDTFRIRRSTAGEERFIYLDFLNDLYTFGNFDNAKDFLAFNPGGVGGGIGFQVVSHTGLPVIVVGDAANAQTQILSPTAAQFLLLDETSNQAQMGSSGGGTVSTQTTGKVLIDSGVAILFQSVQTQTNYAAAQVGTLNNAPTAGNPAKWVAINDNGTLRKIPTWL